MAADGSIIIDTKIRTDGMNSATADMGKQFDKMASSSKKMSEAVESSFTKGFTRSVEMAKLKVQSLETELAAVSAKLEEALAADDDKAAASLGAQQASIYDKLVAARQRLEIETKAAAERQAAAEAAAARKAEAAQAKSAGQQQSVVAKAYSVMSSAAQKTASVMSKAFSKVYTGVKGIASGISKAFGTMKNLFSSSGKSADKFGNRLKSIVSSALFFNLISSGLRKVTDYFSDAISGTNEMQSALANLKGAAQNAAAPIVSALTPALASLANTAATVFHYVSQLVTFLTGKIAAAAKTAQKSASGAAKAAKEASRSLASFDAIERLGGNEDSSGGGGTGTIEPNYNFQGQSPFLDAMLEAVKAGEWETVGSLVAEKVNSSLDSVSWDGVYEKARQWTTNLVDTLNGFITKLDWGLVGQTIGGGLNTAIISLGTFFSGLDWSALGAGLAQSLNGIVDSIDWAALGKLLSDGFKNALNSIATFLAEVDWQGIGNAIETFLDTVDWSGIASALMRGIGAAIAGIGSLIWAIIEDEWNSVVEWWKEVAYEDGEFTMEGLLKGIGDVFANIGQWIKDNIFKPFMDGFQQAFDIHSPSGVMEEQGDFLIQGLFNGVRNAWNAIPNFFTEAFNSVKDAISDIWNNGILPAIRNPINSIIGFINRMIQSVASGINSISNILNRFSFTIPDWVPYFGGNSFGFNLGTIEAPQIPYLAQGAVIPPKSPFMAVLGDQRHGTNIEAPLETIQEAVALVMEDMTGGMMAGFEANKAVLEAILEAIYGLDTSDERYAKAVDSYNRKMAVARGV